MFVESKVYSDANETLIVSEINKSRHISDMKQIKYHKLSNKVKQ